MSAAAAAGRPIWISFTVVQSLVWYLNLSQRGLTHAHQTQKRTANSCSPSSVGLLYQRMLTAEQSLKNEHYPFQERYVQKSLMVCLIVLASQANEL